MDMIILIHEQGVYALAQAYNEDFVKATYMLENFEFEEVLEHDEYQLIGYIDELV